MKKKLCSLLLATVCMFNLVGMPVQGNALHTVYAEDENERTWRVPEHIYYSPLEEEITYAEYKEKNTTITEYRYFQCEPLIWNIVAEEDGTLFAMADEILDCQLHDNTAELYWHELHPEYEPRLSVDEWLDENFVEEAFSTTEQGLLLDVSMPTAQQMETFSMLSSSDYEGLSLYATEYAESSGATFHKFMLAETGAFWVKGRVSLSGLNDTVGTIYAYEGGVCPVLSIDAEQYQQQQGTTSTAIELGNYPQKEIIGSALTEEILNAEYDENGYCIVEGVRYKKLGITGEKEPSIYNRVYSEMWGVCPVLQPDENIVIPNDETGIPDAALYQILLDIADENKDHNLTMKEAKSCTRITEADFAEENVIRDLTGIEYCANLLELDLSGQKITDISSLMNLTKLIRLDLSNNKIRKLPADFESCELMKHFLNTGLSNITFSLKGNLISVREAWEHIPYELLGYSSWFEKQEFIGDTETEFYDEDIWRIGESIYYSPTDEYISYREFRKRNERITDYRYFKCEPLIWSIVSEEEGALCAIASEILDCQLRENDVALYWQKSNIEYQPRLAVDQWLMERFTIDAFSAEEQEVLLGVSMPTEELEEEVLTVCSESEALTVTATAYARANGAQHDLYMLDQRGDFWRNGNLEVDYGYGDLAGTFYPYECGVRPVITIDIEKYGQLQEITSTAIELGSYPQTELTGSALTEDILNAKYDENGYCTIDGVRYKKLGIAGDKDPRVCNHFYREWWDLEMISPIPEDNFVITNDEKGIPDETLYQIILENADADEDGQLTVVEAMTCTQITKDQFAEGKVVSDVRGIGYCSQLTDLYLKVGQVQDLTPLKFLDQLKILEVVQGTEEAVLEQINLSHMESLEQLTITGISTLKAITLLNMKKLEELDLSHNNISTIPILNQLNSLVVLNLSENKIETLPEDLKEYEFMKQFEKVGFADITFNLKGNLITVQEATEKLPESLLEYEENGKKWFDEQAFIDAEAPTHNPPTTLDTDYEIVDGCLYKVLSGAYEGNALIIPDTVHTITGGAIDENCTAQAVIIPESVKRIERNAFVSASAIKEVYLPKEIKTIDLAAFSGVTDGFVLYVYPENEAVQNYRKYYIENAETNNGEIVFCNRYAADLDESKKVDLEDARIALKVALGIVSLEEQETLYADRDCDGSVTLVDAREILKEVLGIE